MALNGYRFVARLAGKAQLQQTFEHAVKQAIVAEAPAPRMTFFAIWHDFKTALEG